MTWSLQAMVLPKTLKTHHAGHSYRLGTHRFSLKPVHKVQTVTLTFELAKLHDTLSCQDNYLCHITVKSHQAGQSNRPDMFMCHYSLCTKLNAHCDFDLQVSSLATYCHDDHLCLITLKFHHAGQSYVLDSLRHYGLGTKFM